MSLTDGKALPGWPIGISDGLRKLKVDFNDSVQEQFGALTMLGTRLYVPFGGYGDCRPYNGRVVEVDTSKTEITAAWATRASGGGIWASGGILSDNQTVIFSTGNSFGAKQWGDGEGIFRLEPGLSHRTDPRQSFSPLSWKILDDEDKDLGG